MSIIVSKSIPTIGNHGILITFVLPPLLLQIFLKCQCPGRRRGWDDLRESHWNVYITVCKIDDFPVALKLKNLPAMQETQVPSLGQEDPLEEGMATHSSILVCRIPWTEEPGGYSPCGHKESDTTEQLTLLQLCKIDNQCEFDVWCRAPKTGALWWLGGMGWEGRWEEGFRMGGHMYAYGRFILMYGKSHHNIVN